jgi:integrase/recombinase XerC/integrase/recombinase XerD
MKNKKEMGQYSQAQHTLKRDEIIRLISATKNLREKIIISSAYYPGLRRFEIAKIRVEDIDIDDGSIIVKSGKGNKTVKIPVGKVFPEYIQDLKHYMQFIKRKDGYLFSIEGNKPLGNGRINQIFNEVAKRADLKHPNPVPKNVYIRRKKQIISIQRKINPHLLRHSIARHLKDMGFRMEFVKNYMRHESIETTMDMYGTMSYEDMEKEAENISIKRT